MAELVLTKIIKNYGAVPVIKDIDLAVEQGEFVSILGASGCGKSTLLSMIAGLETPTSGQISFQDRLLIDLEKKIWVEPENRHFGVVFQSYALWPHMTIEQNLVFPLKLRKMASAEQRRRISEIIELVDLQGLEKRYPGQLSGGQQQRVALARALVYRPQLLLLDEPLSNLDALLREQARIWLKELQMQMGITTLYVTHDQTEALSLSDRIVVMRAGQIEQVGTPQEIYKNPSSSFVASFVGSANFLSAHVIGVPKGAVQVKFADGQQALIATSHVFSQDEQVKIAIRPEHLYHDRLRIAEDTSPNQLKVELTRSLYIGNGFEHEGRLGQETLHIFGEQPIDPGAAVFYFSQFSAIVFANP